MIEILVVFLILLQLADAMLTIAIIRAGGHEMNPLLVRLDAWLRMEFDTHARWAWLAIAKGAVIALLSILYAAGVWHTPGGGAALGALAVFYVFAVRHNWREYRVVQTGTSGEKR